MKYINHFINPRYLFSGLLTYVLILSSMISAGCKNEEGSIAPESETAAQTSVLIKADLLGEYSTSQIKNRIGNRPEIGLFTKYNVKVYKITYNTLNVDNKLIQASGALIVPVVNKPLPLISHQHGTITDSKQAPSAYGSGSESWTFGTVLASAGFIVAAPDYIGYGVSKDIPHPYEHASSLASASLDMLRASKEFFAKNKINFNDQLFLAGYSEGGYSTMALHKLIEEKHAGEFSVAASAPGAGAYNKSAFAKDILTSDKPLQFINSYLWVLQTYNKVYGLNRPVSHYINQPYAKNVETKGLEAEVSKYPKQLFTAKFRQDVLNNQDADMLSAFKDNDIYDWKPKAPMLLLHGTDDDFVPFYNSQSAYDAMQARGATQVQLKRIEGGNHFSSVAVYTLETFLFFSSFLQQ
jgi:alpha-beta hydrolase superfamily lysophospholipase